MSEVMMRMMLDLWFCPPLRFRRAKPYLVVQASNKTTQSALVSYLNLLVFTRVGTGCDIMCLSERHTYSSLGFAIPLGTGLDLMRESSSSWFQIGARSRPLRSRIHYVNASTAQPVPDLQIIPMPRLDLLQLGLKIRDPRI